MRKLTCRKASVSKKKWRSIQNRNPDQTDGRGKVEIDLTAIVLAIEPKNKRKFDRAIQEYSSKKNNGKNIQHAVPGSRIPWSDVSGPASSRSRIRGSQSQYESGLSELASLIVSKELTGQMGRG